MFKKFTLFWLTVLVVMGGFLYVRYVYPETSNATESVDLYEAYNLSPEQIEKWMDTHSPEEVQKMVEEHILKEIDAGKKKAWYNQASKELYWEDDKFVYHLQDNALQTNANFFDLEDYRKFANLK